MIFPSAASIASLALVASSVSAGFAKRQDSGLPGGAAIPDACTETCASTLTLYQACESGDTATCLQICGQEQQNSLASCIVCGFENEEFTETMYNTLLATVQTLTTSCAAVGQANTPAQAIPPYSSLTAIYATATFASNASPSATDAESASAASSSASVEASSASSSVASATSSLAAVISSGAATASASAQSMSSALSRSMTSSSSARVSAAASSAAASASASVAPASAGSKTAADSLGGFAGVLAAGLGAVFLL